jgi:hypothetical protein
MNVAGTRRVPFRDICGFKQFARWLVAALHHLTTAHCPLITAMTVAYKELSGSPVEQYGADGMTATRLFICPWDDRDAFVEEILGEGYQSGVTNPVAYPGAGGVVATSVKVEPLADDLEIQDLGDLAGGLNAYHGFAKVTVSYKRQAEALLLNAAAGIALQGQLTYSTELTYDEVTLPAGDLYLPGNTQVSFPTGSQGKIRIPVTKHILTWNAVTNPPWTAIRNSKGTWNNDAFLGAAAGTLFFDGAKVKGAFSSISSLGECPDGCVLEYTFRERPLAAQSTVGLVSITDFSLLLQAEEAQT